MAAKRGSELLIKRGDGADPEVFTTVGALQSATVTFDGQPIDVTTADDVDGSNQIWRTYISGVKEMSISGNGIGKVIEPVQSVYEDFAAGSIVNFEVVVPFVGTWTVPMIVSNMTFNGPFDGTLGFDIALNSAGAPTFVAET